MVELLYGPPLKLYDLCIDVVIADCISECKQDFRLLPNTALLDFYERLFQEDRLSILDVEFSQLDVISRLLYVRGKRSFVIQCYQSILNRGTDLNQILLNTFEKHFFEGKNGHVPENVLIEMGLQLGAFLNDVGWFHYSKKMLNYTDTMILRGDKLGVNELLKLLELYRLRLCAETFMCAVDSGAGTITLIKKVLRKLNKLNAVPNLARIYVAFSRFYFMICSYDMSYKWSLKALESLSSDLTKRVITDVLRQVSKSCVVKRKFAQAGFLIGQAMNIGEMLYTKQQHLVFSDILMDYAYYLLNSDSVAESVYTYERALDIRTHMFEKNNIYLALSHEDLAYAMYVSEYNTGNFRPAMEHVEESIKILEEHFSKDHLLLASVKRVKALIMEEVALEIRSCEQKQKRLFTTAEELHITALRLSRENYGEKNVQTAKHYGNLGRLYQSMKQFDEAERMHKKAIEIKEKLLGPKDYEVALSIGHLASLYNYHMKKYEEAEKLYQRSIEINITLFGPTYSGLEYDYKGLIHVYTKLGDPENVLHYHTKRRELKALREKIRLAKHEAPILSPKEIIRIFSSMGKKHEELQAKRAQLVKPQSLSSNLKTAEIANIADSIGDFSSIDLNDIRNSSLHCQLVSDDVPSIFEETEDESEKEMT